MKTTLYWLALIALSILCPVSWTTTSIGTEPEWVGQAITPALPVLRIVFSIGLAALLAAAIRSKPVAA